LQPEAAEVNTMLRIAASLVSVGCVIALVACTHDTSDGLQAEPSLNQYPAAVEESESKTPGSVTNDKAIKGIVSARCAREERCKNIGADKDYADKGACERKVSHDMRDDLSPKECPRGIKESQLNKCVESIQKEDCKNPLDKIGRLVACRSGELCLEAD
jgi:Family of unknown function (DUF6184)